MIALLTGLLAAASAPDAVTSAAMCEVGQAALHDLPGINHNPGFDTYYAGASPDRRELLTVCPQLSAALPVGYPIADADALARAKVGAPIPGQHVREAFIYSIDVPDLSADLTTAVVHMGYSCTGLCGAGFEVRYVRTATGWKRQGEIRTLFVS